MIETTTPLTLSLATAFGAYLIAGGLSGLIGQERWQAILSEFLERPGLTYISGVFVFTLGTALVLVHNIWTDPLAILISLVGWAALIEGLILIAAPKSLLTMAEGMITPGRIRPIATAVTVLGVIILIIGLAGTAG